MMHNRRPGITELSKDIDRLNALSARSEVRLRTLELRRRWFPWIVLSTSILAFILGHFSAGPRTAQAEGVSGLLKETEQDIAKAAKTGIDDLLDLEKREQQRFHAVMEDVRRDLNRAEDKAFAPGIAIAVILHDMKRMLEAVPRMADDMHRMTGDMHEMNQKMSAVPVMAAEMGLMNRQMGVMSHGVDSTMGRMGRMMPWMP